MSKSNGRANPDDRAQTEQAGLGLQVISIPQVNLHRETKEPRQYGPRERKEQESLFKRAKSNIL